METSSIAPRLGFEAEDRVVIIHADDVGMCHASLAAFVDLVSTGLVFSASVMVTSPWFPGVAACCRNLPAADIGVHITLTSEWQDYRWGPISGRDPSSGLIDAQGYFHRSCDAFARNGQPEAIAREMRAQLDRAEMAGIDVTHVDNHMFSLFEPGLLPLYFELGLEHEMPAVAWCASGQPLLFAPELDDVARRLIRQWQKRGMLMVDNLVRMARLSLGADFGP